MCLCNNVSRRRLEDAWRDGARSVEALAALTRATTGCGGCEPDVRDLVARFEGPTPSVPAPRPRRVGPGERRTLVVVGNGMVGHRLVTTLHARDQAGQWRITVLGKEPHPAYDRVSLSSYLDGRSAQDLTLAADAVLADPAVVVRRGCEVVGVDRAARTVRTSHGDTVGYDALVLATGSHPFVPPLPGRRPAGCFVYRTFEDLDAIRAAAAPGRPCVVVGGGVLGLEAASALRGLGLVPQVVERAPHLMAGQLDAGQAHALAQELREGLGLGLHCGVGIERLAAGPDGVVGRVELTDGRVLPADLVVFAAGIVPADELAEAAGLARGERGGFLVDRHCRTDDPRVRAIGECAAVAGRCHGLVAPGYRMADLVARELLGEPAPEFSAPDVPPRLKLLGAARAAAR
ncbi:MULTISPECIES: FAD-dependent oxidoreductase [unclassified Streptomyces]|uniref:FAD-dependent oxidoreductase n=1 Tax=Streptomyces sp. KL109B TaxID=3045155 RepID=UPI00278BD61C|nr:MULTISPECIES: FAD-dependent oxidoreductase [unclassified Streptomyces]